MSNLSARGVEKIKKQMSAIFRGHGLEITIQANKKRVQFLDVYLDLETGEYGHTDSVEHFDDFRRRKSGQNDDFRGRFYAVAEFASLGAENGYCLTIFGKLYVFPKNQLLT